MIRKGRLKINRKIPSGSVVKYEDMTEIPVIPPSVIRFGTRNSSKATETMMAPITIKINLITILPTDLCLCCDAGLEKASGAGILGSTMFKGHHDPFRNIVLPMSP